MKTNKIQLKESELLNLIKEYSNTELKFKSNLSRHGDVDFYNFNYKDLKEGLDFEVDEFNFTIEWFMDLDVRETGLNNLLPAISNVTGYVDIILLDDNGDFTNNTDRLEFNFKEMGFELTANVDDATFNSLYVREIRLMFNKKEVEVIF